MLHVSIWHNPHWVVPTNSNAEDLLCLLKSALPMILRLVPLSRWVKLVGLKQPLPYLTQDAQELLWSCNPTCPDLGVSLIGYGDLLSNKHQLKTCCLINANPSFLQLSQATCPIRWAQTLPYWHNTHLRSMTTGLNISRIYSEYLAFFIEWKLLNLTL